MVLFLLVWLIAGEINLSNLDKKYLSVFIAFFVVLSD